jgi:hypothetical protein
MPTVSLCFPVFISKVLLCSVTDQMMKDEGSSILSSMLR